MSNVLKTSEGKTNNGPVYLDCNATTPIEREVQEQVVKFMEEEFGNAGSRTHEYGNRAKVAVQRARDQVAALVQCEREEVLFTSGATESNNLALLGLRAHAESVGRKHVVSTAIEHKAVLEPLEHLAKHGFEVTLVPSDPSGLVDPAAVRKAMRPDTLLVSVMHVNNETGVVQPLAEIVAALEAHEAFLHIDAAQGFGKRSADLIHRRIDLISISAHKLYGPKGVGALVARRRGFERLPLSPLVFGGGQERGLRAGTLPVPLVVGLGMAAALAKRDSARREKRVREIREAALRALTAIDGVVNGQPEKILPSTLNISFPGLDSEAMMLALKHDIAISNGSACTSQSYEPSHVLLAMGLPADRVASALRFSWCHLTPDIDWDQIARKIRGIR